MIKEAVILSGGLGTRLRDTVPDLPKTMAPVAGKPFLQYVIDFLLKKKVESIILSLGYMPEKIIDFIDAFYPGAPVQYVIEQEPLGTGGAVLNAASRCTEKDIFVLNGDTFFNVDLSRLSAFHKQTAAACTLSLKPMRNIERYGLVVTDKEGHVQSFLEKQYYSEGLINGGVYALNLEIFRSLGLPAKFSFEKDFLERFYPSQKFMGLVHDNYFIDIGIPEDFAKAQEDFTAHNF